MNRTEDVEVCSRTSPTIRSAENLLASVNMAEDAEIGERDGADDETVKRSLFRKLSGPTEYLISLRSEKKEVSLNSFGYGWSS